MDFSVIGTWLTSLLAAGTTSGEGGSTAFWNMGAVGMLYVLLILVVILCFLGVVGKKGMELQRAKLLVRARSTNEEGYRRLAEEATRVQSETAEQLKRLEAIDARLVEVERMLREVDEPTRAH